MIIRQTNPTSEKDVFRLVTRVRQRKNSEFSRGTKIFSLSHAPDKTKNIILYFFTKLKISKFHLILHCCFFTFQQEQNIALVAVQNFLPLVSLFCALVEKASLLTGT